MNVAEPVALGAVHLEVVNLAPSLESQLRREGGVHLPRPVVVIVLDLDARRVVAVVCESFPAIGHIAAGLDHDEDVPADPRVLPQP